MPDTLNTSIPEVVINYKYTLEIDTTPTETTRAFATLCAGINNISEALNEQVQQYFFFCGQGFATNYVTGMAPSFTLTGVRVLNDTAQNYIFGFATKYGTSTARETHLRFTRTGSDGTTSIISANVTLCNITDVGGGTTDGSAISVEIRFNGAPVSGDAW